MLFAAGTTGNVFGYLYLIFAGRALTPELFAGFGALYGIFYIFCLAGDALRITIATNVAALKGKFGESAAMRSTGKAVTKIGVMGLLLVLGLMASSEVVASFFHIKTSVPIIVLGAVLCSAILLFVLLGLLQGLQLFRRLALSGYLLPHAFKLVFGVLFVWLGWGLVGIIGALLASNLIAIIVGVVPLVRLAGKATESNNYLETGLASIALPVMLLGITIAVPTSVDVMLVTHFFSSKSAGIYNAVATFGKVVLFLPIAVSLVMLPKVSENHAAGQDTIRILKLSSMFVLFSSGFVVVLYWVIPRPIIDLFFGKEYMEAAPLMGWYGIAMLLFAINYLFAQYYLAISKKAGVLTAIVITLAEVVAIIVLHRSLLQVAIVLVFGNLCLMLLNLFLLTIRQRAEAITEQRLRRTGIDLV